MWKFLELLNYLNMICKINMLKGVRYVMFIKIFVNLYVCEN